MRKEIRVIAVSTAAHGFGVWAKNYNHLRRTYQNLYEENLGEVLEFVDPSFQFAEKQEPATFLGLN
jgi:hypothetical protein